MLDEGHYALGYIDINHPRYLKFPTYILDAWVLFDEARMFNSPFNWLTNKRELPSTCNRKKFCSVVQASSCAHRDDVYDSLSKIDTIDSPGPWKQNIESLNKHKYHSPKYIGRIDGLTYKDKIQLMSKYNFNIAYQSHEFVDHLIQEKIIHAYAANTVLIFRGNKFVEEVINPARIINSHRYDNTEELASQVRRINENPVEYNKIIKEPIFVNNILPEEFSSERMLDFLEAVIEK